MIILIHTSKTMRPPATDAVALAQPILLDRAVVLDKYLKRLSIKEITKVMQVSPKLASATHKLISGWTDQVRHQRPAIDSFLGDIYSGLQVGSLSTIDRDYAQQHLHILSGLYGILRPLDGIYPYRLEMGYKLRVTHTPNLYNFWQDDIAKTLPSNQPIINLAAKEYSKVVTDYIDEARVITPSFLTVSPKTGEPTFVVVHAKIARGAFAKWLITHQVDTVEQLKNYSELNYTYDKTLSTPSQPVFVCQTFGGLGLSVRLS